MNIKIFVMKNSVISFGSLPLLATLIFINISCTPERPARPSIIQVPPPPPRSFSNQWIWVDAKRNTTIERPLDFAILNGSVTGPGINGSRVRWEQTRGAAGCIIENPDSVITKVSNLLVGSYQFKLTGTAISGVTMSDTMTVTVQEATSPSRQIFFSNLEWECLMGCSIYLGYSMSFLPAGYPITVYIRRENMSTWELVVPESVFTTEKYFYNIWGGQLSVFENSNIEATDHPEVKVVF